MKIYQTEICKGDYTLGTACDHCERCADQKLALMTSGQWNKIQNTKPNEWMKLERKTEETNPTIEDLALWIEKYFLLTPRDAVGKLIAAYLRDYNDLLKNLNQSKNTKDQPRDQQPS